MNVEMCAEAALFCQPKSTKKTLFRTSALIYYILHKYLWSGKQDHVGPLGFKTKKKQ